MLLLFFKTRYKEYMHMVIREPPMLVSQVIFDVGERVYPDKARAMVAGCWMEFSPALSLHS